MKTNGNQERGHCIGLVVVAIVLALTVASWSYAEPATDMVDPIRKGEHWFQHRWQYNDEASRQGDGLGPLHNANSCVACHHQGGMGGGGTVDQNVMVLTVPLDVDPTREVLEQAFENALLPRSPVTAKPDGFVNVVLHRRGRGADFAYTRERILAVADQQADVHITQRNTPALFGAAQLDQVKLAMVVESGRQLASRYATVSGRVGPVDQQDSFGRFGWRAQVESLEAFVKSACANELGLQLEDVRQPPDPTSPATKTGADIDKQQLRELVAYVASLPAPYPHVPSDADQRELAQRGQAKFAEAGCVACHVQSLGPAKDAYSDMLLHDMGESLYDPQPAKGVPKTIVTTEKVSTPDAYYTVIVSTKTVMDPPLAECQREWRTPPLWGVADSAPYLHDGRATTLTEAIAAHGGEAAFAREYFFRMLPSDQTAVLAFLDTLKAP
ncbi:MAG: hypothetical protein KDA60_07560 [Planctomycetales bacterium]|nr:hypothetical protein [Planctomycetales bacterium]